MSDQHYSGASTPKGRRDEVIAAEKRKFGGMKFGSAFFGWLTATGMTVLLTTLAAAISAGVATNIDPGQIAQDATTAGIISGIVLTVVLFIAYFCGGYVAGRMARFDGVKQGIAVWLWAILIAVLLAVLGAVAGPHLSQLGQLNGLPRIPIGDGNLTVAGIRGGAGRAGRDALPPQGRPGRRRPPGRSRPLSSSPTEPSATPGPPLHDASRGTSRPARREKRYHQ